jgi:Tol biopolymer transport system component
MRNGFCRLLLLILAAHGLPAAQIERISMAAGGGDANGASGYPAISADGRFVAYQTTASNIVAGDVNGVQDVIWFDREQRTSRLVSVSSAGAIGNGPSRRPSMSADGRFVVFESRATNLVSGDSNGQNDIFVHDTLNHVTTRVSVASGGAQANNYNLEGRLSADGRFVVFLSDATNLVTGDTNSERDVFVHDRQSGVTTRVNLTTSGAQADGITAPNDFDRPAISGDGRYVVFNSFAANLGDSFGSFYVRDRTAGTTTRIAKLGNEDRAGIDRAGNVVVVPTLQALDIDGDNLTDAAAWMRTVNAVRAASPGSSGSIHFPDISPDGGFVAYIEESQDDLFLRDLSAGLTYRMISTYDGAAPRSTFEPGSGPRILTAFPAVSDQGQAVAFESYIDNLVADDRNDQLDVFVALREQSANIVRINFQPAASPVPTGYLVDSGAAFSARGNGQTYGWDVTNGYTRDRNSLAAADQRYDTLNHMQAAGNRRWEIALPNGSYRVHVVCGDPAFIDGNFKVDAEGVRIVDGAASSSRRWVEGARTIQIADGRLTISNAAGAVNNKICFIDIQPLASAVFAAKVNFQPASAPVPPGFLIDSGNIYGDRGNGFAYGWNLLTDMTRDRNNSLSPNQAYDTLNHMQSAANPNASWQCAVPNGWYEVHVVCGDPSFLDGNFKVQVESVLTVDGRASSSNRWFEGTRSVQVSDGRLTVANAPGAVNNKICFIEIMQAPTAVN